MPPSPLLKNTLCGTAFILALILPALGQDPALVNRGPEHDQRMEWWRDARFGLFIHWGLYSLPGGLWKGESARKDYAEWVMHNFQIPFDEYSQLARDFNPTKFDPDAWAKLAKEAGMGYFVLTTKHHDGFAMFDSAVSDYDIIDATPFDRDVFGELAEAFRKQGLRACAYYSQDLDWSQPQGSPIESYNLWDFPFTETNDDVFDHYFHTKALPQVEELLTRYGDISVFWFDLPRMMNAERGQALQDLVRKHQPDAIINGRICNPQGLHADYLVPGDNGYFTSPQPADWECCATMDESWGYKINAHTNRSANDLIVQLATTVSAGGNLLLNIGPKPDGTIPQRQVDILQEIAVWMKDNREAIHGNRANPFGEFFPWGIVTVKGPHIYLHITDWQEGGKVLLPRLRNEVQSVQLLGDSQRKLVWNKDGGNLKIELAGEPVHPASSVIKVTAGGNALEIAPFALAEASGSALLECRYARSLASRLRFLRHHSVGGVVVCDLTGGHPTERLEWDVTVDRPGTFEVMAEFHKPHHEGLAPRDITVSASPNNKITGRVTAESLRGDRQSLGTLTLDQAGVVRLTLQVQGGGRAIPLYLNALHLTRIP